MKKVLSLLLLFSFLISCSSDKYENLKEHPIVGEWTLDYVSHELDIDASLDYHNIEDILYRAFEEEEKHIMSLGKLRVIFEEDGTFVTYVGGEFNGSGSYKIKKDRITMSDSESSEKFLFELFFDQLDIVEDQTTYYKNSVIGGVDKNEWTRAIKRVLTIQKYSRVR